MRFPRKLFAAAVLGLVLTGCGPLSSPLPQRLNDDDQKKVEKSWNDAFNPANRLDRQTLLDAYLVSYAYEAGVDRLTMRSEKKLDSGLLIMEIHFDRGRPDADRFEVNLVGPDGATLRHEAYTRGDIERTQNELDPQPLPPGAAEAQQQEWVRKQEKAKQRLEIVKGLLPGSRQAKNN